ncbi:MAG: Lrp/AsnC family transcriptional regulator [Pedobacter sp.]|uniref:Lrp/AsnC family transcriptional regulator n=1 Tax=Pedobacter sp. TaxID=1411316 RepID=UPI003396F4F1
MKEELNGLDMELLRHYQDNASLTNRQMARKVNKSEATVCNRRKKLEKMGALDSIKAQLNPAFLNIDAIGFVELSVERQSDTTMQELKTQLDLIKGICSCISITGTTSLEVKIAAENTRAFNRIKDRIASIPHVTVVKTKMLLEEIIPDKGYHF